MKYEMLKSTKEFFSKLQVKMTHSSSGFMTSEPYLSEESSLEAAQTPNSSATDFVSDPGTP